MTDTQPNHDDGQTDDRFKDDCGRRTFIAVGGGVGATMLAGCTLAQSPDEPNDETQTDGSTGAAHDGNFQLLLSDMPADIGDFDRLDVTLEYARIFDGADEESNGGGGDDTKKDPGDERDDEEADEPAAEQASDEEEDEANGDKEDETNDAVERERGFYILDLAGATVDLTAVVGDKAVSVFEGELSPGTYEKIELHVEDVEGIVDGERATVKVPSEKLQITHPFEISADESVDFVFDINVVKRGKGNDYNLKPVISESGVAGKDVDVEAVDDDHEDTEENATAEDADSGGSERDEATDEADTGEDRDTGGDE